MDNNKIGKLISDLRRRQGLTQEQLGDKVGVGFRAVSKWERGLTLPDISIINDLSKVLGISSDELLSGELKEKPKDNIKKKSSSYIAITISIITSLIILITSIFIYQNNKTYSYKLVSLEPEEYYVSGIVNREKDNISITINQIDFKDKLFYNEKIKNYEYEIFFKDEVLFGYGYIDGIIQFENPITIKKFTEKFSINYIEKTTYSKEEFENNGIKIKFKFITEQNDEINKEIIINVESIKK